MFSSMKSLKVFSVLMVAAGLSACTQGTSWVQSASVNQSIQNNDHYVELAAVLNTGSVNFAAIGLPIMNTSGKIYGQVNVIPVSAGVASLSVTFDIDSLGKFPTGSFETALPNGYPFPIVGAHFMSYQVGTGGSAFYEQVSADAKTATVGIALVIPGFISQIPASAFVPFTISANFSGMAGAFTAPTAAQSGFALFANLDFSAPAALRRPMPVMVPTPTNAPDSVRIRNMLSRLNSAHAQIRVK